MNKEEILIAVEELVASENDLATLRVKLYDLNFAYNRLICIEKKEPQ